jgi:effector-binding domain-containing protein/uncharacterized membrane protein
MKALKVILGIIGVLIAGYLVLCLVGPKSVDASSTATIEAPASMVYETVSDLTTWGDWGTWQKADPDMAVSYGETSKGLGGNYSWTSETSGNGNMEIVEATPPNSMKTRIQFDDFAGYSYGSWEFSDTEAGSEVTWTMSSDPTPFMFRGMMALMGMNKAVEKDFSEGLANLKALVEEQAANMPTSYGGYEVAMADYPGGFYAGVREQISMDQMTNFLGESYGKAMGAMAENGVEMAGMPCALYYSWDIANGTTDMAAVIPIPEATNLGEEVAIIELPQGKSATIDYYGAYEGIGAAHEAMDEFFAASGHTPALPAMEIYVTDPTTEPDTSKWLSKVVYFYE